MRDIKWGNVYGYPANPRAMLPGITGIARYGGDGSPPYQGGNLWWWGTGDHTQMYHVTGWFLYYRGDVCCWTLVDPSGQPRVLPHLYAGAGMHMRAWRMAEAIVRHGWPTQDDSPQRSTA